MIGSEDTASDGTGKKEAKGQDQPSPESSPAQIVQRSQLRLRMPQRGPMMRTKLSLLMKKSRTSVRVLMLACLGMLRRRAISPKQSPFLQAQTNLFSPSFRLQATNCPSATKQKQFPISPSLIINFSGPTRFYSKLQNSLVFSQMSRSLKKSILAMRVSHSLNFSIILLLRTRLNSCRSSQKSLPEVMAVMVVALGWLQSKESYPNIQPALYSFIISGLPLFQHLNRPSQTMQRMLPLSPSRTTTSPFSTLLDRILEISWSMLSCERCSKKMHFLRCMIRLTFVSSEKLASLFCFSSAMAMVIFLQSWLQSPEIPFLSLLRSFNFLFLLSWKASSSSSSLITSFLSSFRSSASTHTYCTSSATPRKTAGYPLVVG